MSNPATSVHSQCQRYVYGTECLGLPTPENIIYVVPVMNGHPRDQAKVSVHCRWPLIRGNLTLKCVGRGIDNVAVQGMWPLTTGVAQGRYYCIDLLICIVLDSSMSPRKLFACRPIFILLLYFAQINFVNLLQEICF